MISIPNSQMIEQKMSICTKSKVLIIIQSRWRIYGCLLYSCSSSVGLQFFRVWKQYLEVIDSKTQNQQKIGKVAKNDLALVFCLPELTANTVIVASSLHKKLGIIPFATSSHSYCLPDTVKL